MTGDGAEVDAVPDEVAALANLFQVFGGVLLILFSMLLFMTTGLLMNWIGRTFFGVDLIQAQYPSILEISISIVFSIGLFVLFLMVIFWALPIKMHQLNDSLLQGTGLILLVYPLMTVKQVIHYDLPAIFTFGIETPYWFVYSIIGFILLLHPMMMKNNRLRREVDSILLVLPVVLSILIVILTFLQIAEVVIAGAIYTAFLIISPLAVISSTIMHILLPDELGKKTFSMS
ncbi:MAG: hypothetical protein ACFFFC_09365 [Candidatus Thorarchaeota archaeon]